MRPLVTTLAACVLTAGLSACGTHRHPHGAGYGPDAFADLQPTRGNVSVGRVMFHSERDGVFMHARVSGLKPGQEHGFHIHEKGDCSSGDGMSAGGHFNPTGMPHGRSDGGEHHAGDLPSLKADERGFAELWVSLKGLAIGVGPTDIVGKGLIVHAQPDDFRTQPTGNAGARVACAVIRSSR